MSSVTETALRAKEFLKTKGWSDAQAAGIVGNLQQESGVNLNTQAFNPKENAQGIAQWRGSRVTTFEQRYNTTIRQATLEQQLDYVNWELTDGPEQAAGNRLRAETTASGSASVVDQYYERSAGTERNSRIQNAQALSGGIPQGVIGGTTTGPQEPITESAAEDAATTQIYVANAAPIPNRLHNYASYTYSLSLHMLSPDEYNDVVVTQKYNPKNVLIASAGRRSETFPRNKNFKEDFYFDDFNMTTIISPNDVSRNSNAIETNFTIVEPYGFTLVERILKVTEEIGGNNYLDMPYVIQIDFFAVDDAGNQVGQLTELQKRFHAKMTSLQVKVTGRGAEYSIVAIPYGHAAFEGSAITVPANMEVVARTVGDFFQSVEGTANDTYTQDVLAKSQLQQRQEQDAQTAQTQNAPTSLFSSLNQNSAINVDSFGTAINAYCKGLQDANKVGIADVYRFEFLPDPDTGENIIGTAKFVDANLNTPKKTPMKKKDGKDDVTMRISDLGGNKSIYDTTRGIFNINYGTTIEKLLEYVIRNSSYIQDQLVIPDGMSQEAYQALKEKQKDKPLNWFRIIPKVRILGYDKVRDGYAKEYTYTVKPYKMYNMRNDLAPQGLVVTPTKNYNYYFTGQNSDIINLDIQFNALYFTQQTAVRNKMTDTAPTADSKNQDYYIQNAPNYTGGDTPKGPNYNSVMPAHMKSVVANPKATASGDPTTIKEIASGDLAESLMTSSSADMIGIKMSIIGDPDYIKQDDVFFQGDQAKGSKSLATTVDPRLLPNGGSLIMDDSGVYIQLLFKIPRDIDDETGFMKYDTGERNSVFSGLYQVVKVNNNFSQGKFTQELDMVRLPRQIAFDYVGGKGSAGSNARPPEETASDLLGVAVEPPQNTTDLMIDQPVVSDAEAADAEVEPGQDQSAAVINNAEQPTENSEQSFLRSVRNLAPTVVITDQNEQ